MLLGSGGVGTADCLLVVMSVSLYTGSLFQIMCVYYFKLKDFNFMYLFKVWLCWVFVAFLRLSLVEANGGHFPVAVLRLLMAVAFLIPEHRLWTLGLQQLQLVGPRARAQKWWHAGLVALWHEESSQTRDQTHVPCNGRQSLMHCTAMEVLKRLLIKKKKKNGKKLVERRFT